MSLAAAQVAAAILETYVVAGIAFALVFLPRGAARVDPGIARSPITVRLLLAPGVVLLWPVLARRWQRARPSAASRERGTS